MSTTRAVILHMTDVDAAATLADSVSGLGCFVLARNPEIRQKFVQLLMGRDGVHFQSELRARLTHPSIAVRHGAAMVLLLAKARQSLAGPNLWKFISQATTIT